MSNEVDKRVVQMEFDNKRFEKNIKQTKKSLAELDQSLQFNDASKGIDKVSLKISALEVAATTAIATITNKVINLGTVLVKSLSVNNIFAGWQKYGDKTISVATLLAQKIKIAGKEIEDEAKKLEAVNEQLDLLNWFSDETSYSFNDMVSTVGKFTAAGQDLDVSVKAMEGIATWAALSGQNATKASQAMYQLAQAIGAGSVKLMDWKSIQNYNMDTEEFRATILDTAVALGQLTKSGDEFVTKTGKKFSQAQFTTQLSEGWLTSEVLLKGLEKYSAAVDQIYDISIKEGITASEVIEKYGDQLDKFGVKAFKAAQEARTFSDAIASVKDAVSSKWMTSFETIFGGNKGSIQFWTDLANSLYDSFAAAGDFRNEILSVWGELGGSADLFAKGGDKQGAFWNIYDAITAIREVIRTAWNQVFPISEMQAYGDQASDAGRKLKLLTDRLRIFTQSLKISEDNARRLRTILTGVFNVIKTGIAILKAARFAIDPLVEIAKELAGQIIDRLIYYGSKFTDITEVIYKVAIKLQQVLLNLIDTLDLSDKVDKMFDFFEELYELIKEYKPIEKAKKVLDNFFRSFEEHGGTMENLTKIAKGLMSIIKILAKTAIAALGAFLSIAAPVFEVLGSAAGELAGYIAGVIVDLVAKFADMFTALDAAISRGDFADFGEKIRDFLMSIIGLFGKLAPLLSLIVNLIKKLIDVILMIPKMLDNISVRLTGKGIIDNLTGVFDSIINAFSSFTKKREEVSNEIQNGMAPVKGAVRLGAKGGKDPTGMQDALTPFQIFVQGLADFVQGAGKILLALVAVVGKALSILGGIMDTVGQFFIDLASGEKEFKTWQKVLMWIGGVLLALLIPLAIITNSVKNFVWQLESTFLPLNVVADSLSGYFDGKEYEAIGNAIESVANAMLKISIALLLLMKVSDTMSARTKGIIAFIVILGALTATVILLYKYTNQLNDTVIQYSSAARNLWQSFSEIGQSLKIAAALQALAMVINQIGNLMLKIAVAFMLFDKISPKGIELGLNVMLGLLAAIAVLSLTANDKLVGINYRKLMPSLAQMVGFVFLIKSVAKVLIQLSEASTDSKAMWSAVGAIAIVFGVIAAVFALANVYTRTIGSDKKSMKSANKQVKVVVGQMKGMIASMALLLLSFALATKMLSNIEDPNKMMDSVNVLYRFIGIIGLMLGALIVLDKLNSGKTNFSGKSFEGIGKAMKAMSGLMLSFGIALRIITKSGANPNEMWNAVGIIFALVGVLTAMGAVLLITSKIPSKDNGLNSLSKVLRSFSINMLVLAGVMAILSLFSWDKIAKSASIMALALTSMLALIGIMNVLGSVTKKKLIKEVALLTVVMGTLAGMAAIMTYLAKMSWEQVATSAVAMALALTSMLAVIGLIKLMQASGVSVENLLGFSLALTVFSAALVIFAAALLALSSVGLTNLLVGLVGVAGALATLFIISKLAAPSITTMIALAAALALIGVGLLMAGIGLQAMTNSLTGLGDDAENLLPRILEIITGIATGLIDVLLDSISKVAESIIENAPIIGEMIKTLVLTALDVLNSTAPQIISTVVSLLDTVLTELASHSESICNAIVTIIVNALAALDSRFDEICDHIFSMIHKLLVVMKGWIPIIGRDIVDIIVILLETIVRELGPKIPYILKLIVTFVGQVLEGLMQVVVPLAGLVTKVMLVLLGLGIKLLIVSLGALSSLFVELVGSILLIITHTFVGMADVIYEVLRTLIYNVVVLLNKILAEVGRLIPKMLVSGFSAFIGGILQGFVDILDAYNFGWIADALGIRNAAKSMMSVTDRLFDQTVLIGNNVKTAIKKASNNIMSTVGFATKSIDSTLTDSFSKINSTVDSSLQQMDGAMGDFGRQIGGNFSYGLAEGILGSEKSVDNAASEVAKSGIDEICEDLEVHSPSRVMMEIGQHVSEGLAIGIQNGSDQVEENMRDMVTTTTKLANDIVNEQNGDDITLSVGLDISGVEAQSARIQDIMSGIDNPEMSYYGRNANYTSRKLDKTSRDTGVVNNDKSTTVNYENTFNITSTDPKESAEEIDKVLHDQALKAKFAHGS